MDKEIVCQAGMGDYGRKDPSGGRKIKKLDIFKNRTGTSMPTNESATSKFEDQEDGSLKVSSSILGVEVSLSKDLLPLYDI